MHDVAPTPAAPLTWLFVVAGLLGLVSVVVPHDPETSVAGVLAVSALALAAGLGLLRVGDRLRPRGVTALLLLGTLLTSAAIHFTAGVPNASASLYTWIALYAFYAQGRAEALGHLAVIAAVYAAVIALNPPGFPPFAHWTTTIGTLLGAGLLVGFLKERLDEAFQRLAGMARTDGLTGLLNRRAFEDVVEAECRRAARTGRTFALAIVDIDRFKLVNDTLGHAAGDEVLRGFARLLEERSRAIDTAARLGGEEFALLLPDTDAAAAIVLAERLRRAVAGELGEPSLPLTASFGVATWTPAATTPEALVLRADRALYAAKRSGRDRVLLYVPGETEQLLAADETDARAQQALLLLAETLDLRDPSTGAHSATVARYAAAVADRLALEREHVERIQLAGRLHDIGKLGMPDALLQKPGPLTPEERRHLERHPELGARMLEGAGLDELAEWVRCHHERYDGAGYPRGLAGSAIPLEARILAVADAYEAMTADRPYRRALSARHARGELLRHAGTQFDPEIVDLFLGLPVEDPAALAA